MTSVYKLTSNVMTDCNSRNYTIRLVGATQHLWPFANSSKHALRCINDILALNQIR